MTPDEALVQKLNAEVGCNTFQHPALIKNGYCVFFERFSSSPKNTRIVGRWFAWRETPRDYIASICGGEVRRYDLGIGAHFAIPSVVLTLDDYRKSGAAPFVALKKEALANLTAFIDAEGKL
jgi:hypothetical protein